MQNPGSLLDLVAVLLPCACLGAGCVVDIEWDGRAVGGSGHLANEERSVDDYSTVQLSIAADVLVVVGEPTSIILSGDDNLISLVRVEVRDRKLVIDSPRGRDLRFKRGLEVRLGTPDLACFEVEGSGDVEIRNLQRDSFHVSIEGSGNVLASGAVDTLDARIEGSGDLRLQDLQAREAAVSIEGSGEILVKVAESLRYRIEGSGDIRYEGSPQVSGGVEGSGSVRKR